MTKAPPERGAPVTTSISDPADEPPSNLRDLEHHTEPSQNTHGPLGCVSVRRFPGVSPPSASCSTPPPASPGKAAIFAAVPGGSRRARSQREWLRAALAEIESQGWYANRASHYAGDLPRAHEAHELARPHEPARP